MLSLFKRKNNDGIQSLYGDVVKRARDARLYRDFGVADTPIGRFQMIALHAAPEINAMIAAGQGRNAQKLFDMIFNDIELSFREIGVGDLAVPKKMKKWMKDFNGITQAHAAANADHVEITQRNVFGDDGAVSPEFQDYIRGLFK